MPNALFAALWMMLIPMVALAGIDPNQVFQSQVRKIADTLNYKDGARPVDVPGQLIQSVELKRTQWELKSVPQSVALSSSMQSDAMMLPEAERLKTMKRVDDHIQIWAVSLPATPATTPDAVKSKLTPTDAPHEMHRELFYLGQNGNLGWFGYMPIPEFVALSRSLPFKGDDAIAALIRGISIHDQRDCTINSCSYELAAVGTMALPAIDRAIRDRSPQRGALVGAMGNSDDDRVGGWLKEQTASGDADVAGAARETLLARFHPAAGELYLQWLGEDAGKHPVTAELHYCRELKMKGAGPLLPRVLESPASAYEYRLALEFSRELAGQPPLPPAMIMAEQDIFRYGSASGGRDQKKVDGAIDVIVTGNDPQAAAAIGMSLAVFFAKGDVAIARQAGPEILRRLPGPEARRLAELLTRTDQSSSEQEQVKAIAQSLGAR